MKVDEKKLELGREIKAIRKSLGLSQTEAAAKLSVSCMSWWRWEQGKSRPHKSFLKKIAAMAKKVDGDNDEK